MRKFLTKSDEEATQQALDLPNEPKDQDAGVARIENLFAVLDRKLIWLLYLSIFAISWAKSLSASTVYNYLIFGTSHFGQHALLGTINTITSILSAVALPFIAKFADLTSRPLAFLAALFFYVLGFVIVAASPNVQAFGAGQVLYTIGDVGIDLVITILIADLTPLQWRSAAIGASTLPWICNAFIAGYIVSGVGTDGWRWGYGMFTIIMPCVFAPCLLVLFWADKKARRFGQISLSQASSTPLQREAREPWWRVVVYYMMTMDAFGLILLGFAWALILLPFTLSATANDGYANPSLIAMFVVGGLCMIAFFVYESLYAPHPILPRRVLNRTFIICVIIDFCYYFSYYTAGTYWSSWTYVVTDWSLRDWTFSQNILTVGLCFFGFIVGLIQRYTHRYKYLQIFGLCLYVLGQGLTLYAVIHTENNDAAIILAQIILSFGGACSVMGTQVASQASVPHADVSIVIANLSLWTRLGGAIGSAVSANVWTSNMPGRLAKYLSSLLPTEEILAIYGDITVAKAQTADIRAGVLLAYNETVKPLYAAGIGIAGCGLIAAFFASNYYLGKTQNAVTNAIHPVYGEASLQQKEDRLTSPQAESEQKPSPAASHEAATNNVACGSLILPITFLFATTSILWYALPLRTHALRTEVKCLKYCSDRSTLCITAVVGFIPLIAFAAVYVLSPDSPAPPKSKSLPNLPAPKAVPRMAFQVDPNLKLDPPKDTPFSNSELAQYDGTDANKPIYVAVKGDIFDVSAKRDMYGPGAGYHIFAGKDGSRGLGRSSLKPEDALSDYSVLDEKELGVLNHWHAYYSKRYNIVGKVSEEGEAKL